jgi:hypothetical protein
VTTIVRDKELEKGEGDVHKTPLFPLRADRLLNSPVDHDVI